MNEIIEQLQELREIFIQAGDLDSASRISRALDGSEETLRSFITSNSLWGSAGSITDRIGVDYPNREIMKQAILGMLRLGELQIEHEYEHCRTYGWVTSNEKWRQQGI